jgi:predicted polyphosphate/ATP-dependent NAD kinase
VKMRSGVFGLNPRDVAEILDRLLLQDERRYSSAEILDLGVGSIDYSSSEFFGVAKTPYAPDLLQRSKTTHATTSEAGLNELAIHYANNLHKGTLYLFGPGGSTQLILKNLLSKELDAAGVHAVLDGTLVGEDLSEREILELLGRYPNSELVVGVIGGQGYLFGRGNQQLSAAVIDRIGWEKIFILASNAKLLELMPVQLHVDFTEPLATQPPAFVRVNTSTSRSVVCRLLHRVASPDS